MNCEASLIDVKLKSSQLTSKDPRSVEGGGVLISSHAVDLELPEDLEANADGKTIVRCLLKTIIVGKAESDSGDLDEAEELFNLELHHCGLFEVNAGDIQRLHDDEALRSEVTGSFVNRIQPAIRGYILSTLESLGVSGVALPWHLGAVTNEPQKPSDN